jgi:2-amino-4-hydroxy-6-hydroxymethyldihydropteridine diphosphokinase
VNSTSQGGDEDQGTEEVTVFVGLGSNLDDPAGQLQRAIFELAEIPATHLISCSRFYRSAPMGPQDQPRYINAVAKLETSLAPLVLLEQLQLIENAHGRKRTLHWGARTLDLDLLLYGQQMIDTPRLRVPHPGIKDRNFVLYPLQELAPDLEIPGKGTLQELIKNCSPEGLEKYESD